MTNDRESLMTNSCGTVYPLWMDGEIPEVAEGIVDRKVCLKSIFSSCHKSFTIQVKNCCSYRVYYLHSANMCPSSYCVSPSLVPPVDCPGPSTNSTTRASTTTETTTSGDTTTGISTKETKTTTQTTSAKTDEVTAPASERSSDPVIFVLAVVCVVLPVLFFGIAFALYMRCRREKGLPESCHVGNDATTHHSRDMNSAFTENSHYEQLQSKIQSDGEYQDINGSLVNHHSWTNPTTVVHNTYQISEKQRQENCIEGPYYVLNPSKVQSHQSPYEDLKLQTSSNPYDILSQTAADSNKTSNVALKEADANPYTEIQQCTE
ncbi:uncharacterized protein LOC110445796 isoform X2 [Mizuhopecten yessoensis]|nr:uncharacterized protein LOC110445796 isoform X2 [Mizuhopecten yessoensis]XP_021346264.1 uncharacterized protein LOC110445796 isoform X2 [Mizuhopecten yessoensis]